MAIGPIQMLMSASTAQRRTLLAASLGWMLDAFDAMLYALVLAYIMRDLGMSKATSGFLYSLTLLASGIGGILFGFVADHFGRKRALTLSILTYSACSLASGLSTGVLMLACFRFILGLGMGGEWNTGAALVAETWPDHLRAKALSIVQSSWAIGYAIAAAVAGIVLRYYSWRVVFFIGILPAVVTLWIRERVPESQMWRDRQRDKLPPAMSGQVAAPDQFLAPPHRRFAPLASLRTIFRPPYRRSTLCLLLLNFFGMFGWWGLFTWIPPYLSLDVAHGGRGFGLLGTAELLIVLNLFGMFPGYLAFGWIADRLGRRPSLILYLGTAALLAPLYALARSQSWMLVLGAVLAFFATGFFSGSGIVASELFPTDVRAQALGVTYNGARAMSSIAPYVIGKAGQAKGLGWAFCLCGAAFFLASLFAVQLPETRGTHLE